MKQNFSSVNVHIKNAVANGSRRFNNNVGPFMSNKSGFRNYVGGGNAANPGAPFQQGYQNAGGNNGSTLQPTSQPWLIQVQNASASAASVELFGANTHLQGYGTFNTAGTLTTTAGVVISTSNPGTNYRGLLYQTQSQPVMVGLSRFQVTSGTVIPTGINWNNTDQGSGNSNGGILQFPLSDYQQQTAQVTSETAYPMNGNITLSFTIAPTTTLVVWIYPQVIVDASNAVVNQGPVQQYGSPGINSAGTFNVR